MRCLIRFLTRGPAGSVEQRDRVFEGEAVTLGRATDQVLHLKDRRVGLEHARLEPQGGGFRIATSALAGVLVNGRSRSEAALAAGDVIEVGENVLKIIAPPPGFDLAFTFELGSQARMQDAQPAWGALDLAAAGWSKRRWSWIIAVAVLALTLLLPATSLLGPDAATLLRGLSLPSDRWWLAGPIHPAHGGATAACESCHATPFVRVQDAQCLACHGVGRHITADTPDPTGLAAMRCASCHLEHDEPPGLVNARQELCADCHGTLAADAGSLGGHEVTDFGAQHPEFRVSLLQPSPAGLEAVEWNVVRLDLAAARGEDRSNLRFPHSKHLDPEGIDTPDGARALECAECHVPEAGGALLQPIAMEQHCAGCHSLTFDPDDPTRTVPHGDPEAVLQELIEYYSARLLGGDAPTSEQRVVVRPGRPLTRTERERAAAEAEEQAQRVAADLFERRACATCHDVKRIEGAAVAYRVEPVRLTAQFFPHAAFSHAAHDDEVATCADCHAAAASESSADVLVPGIDRCRDCHGGGDARRNEPGRTPTPCIVCHAFHVPAKGEYR
jgi:hypothetical protein